jgi:phenylalanine ammonia-lyase
LVVVVLFQTDRQPYRSGKAVVVDGHTLSIAAVTAAARYNASVTLDDSHDIKDSVLKSRRVIEDKMKSDTSVYGVSTGFGGSGTFPLSYFHYPN